MMTPATPGDPAASIRKQRTFLGHPIGLYVLFFTEMWERFSYYGKRALLIPYMVNWFRWVQKDASTVYKVYTSFVYVTPILGGFLADRYLGNRRAVIIGAVLMAIGHFLMAFEEYAIFYAALAFLIAGNGFFKPNMSTQVGRLYPPNDGRRDGAYTIFYMGVNLGAFLAPLVCGWLQENTEGGYHTGFTMAGIGMVTGLVIYLLGQPAIREVVPTGTAAAHDRVPGATLETAAPPELGGEQAAIRPAPSTDVATRPGPLSVPPPPGNKERPLTEAEAARQPSVLGPAARYIPLVLYALGALLLVAGPVLFLLKRMDQWDGLMLVIAGFCSGLVGYVISQVHGGLRDRILAILILGVFVMFFWAAYEQAGNVLNLWADKHTDRYLTEAAPSPELIPKAPAAEKKGEQRQEKSFWQRIRDMFRLKPRPQESWGDWLKSSLNPVPTAWFQSINALAIFVIAPLFAWMWVALDRRGWQPSIPMKMFWGLVLMSASVAIMIAAAEQENKPTSVTWSGGELPHGLFLADGNKVAMKDKEGHVHLLHAGRLTYDPATKTFHLTGVLPDNEAYRMIEQTAPESFRKKVEELQKLSGDINDESVQSVEVTLEEIPPGFDLKYAGLKPGVIEFRSSQRKLSATQKLADREVKGLLVAGGDPTFRAAVRKLYVESNRYVVSPWWLFWSYILATLGELCLSPVGLSMVSKLAPARFATMLMGVWLLTSAFGNFAAGALGEIWGTIPPVQFFLLATVVVGVAALVLLLLVRFVTRTMHGVK
jgi:POT family proton-dependent oligopeptide transporter